MTSSSTSTGQRAKQNRPQQLFLAQRHAWEHHHRQIGAHECPGFATAPPEWKLRCPICTTKTPFEDLTEEHAPQRSGASLLGSDACVVLTCTTCNSTANLSYERWAADPAVGVEHGVPGACPAHGLRVDERDVLLRVVDELPVVLSDIKSAFIIAFATLGYGWSMAKEVRPIRVAIQSGDLPPEGTCAIVRLQGAATADLVHQVIGSRRCVLVQSRSGVAVQLPTHGMANVPELDGSPVRVKQWAWPVTNGGHNQIWAAREAGNLFHTDFCDRHTW